MGLLNKMSHWMRLFAAGMEGLEREVDRNLDRRRQAPQSEATETECEENLFFDPMRDAYDPLEKGMTGVRDD